MAGKKAKVLEVQYPLRLPGWLNEAAGKLAAKRGTTRAQLWRSLMIRELEQDAQASGREGE